MSQVDKTGAELIDKLTVPASAPPAINLDTPVSFDGKAFTVKQLIDAASAGEKHKADAEKAGKLRSSLKTAFLQEDAADDDRKAALQEMLREAGADDSQVEAIIEAMSEGVSPEDDETPTPGRKSVAAKEEDEEMKAIREMVTRDRTARLLNHMGDRTMKILTDKESKIGKRLSLMVKGGLMSEEEASVAAKKYRDTVVKDATTNARQMLAKLKPGAFLVEGDMDKAVDEAMERLYDTVAVIPEASLLGRLGETVASDPLSELGLPSKEIEFPSARGKNPRKIREELRTFMAQGLVKATRENPPIRDDSHLV